MNVLTAATILQQQIDQLTNVAGGLVNLSNQALAIAGQDNSIAEPNPQIKGLTASMNVSVASITSQMVLVQGALDELAKIVS